MASLAALPLSQTSQQALLAYYKNRQESQNIFRDTRRDRFRTTDMQYQREMDTTQANLDAKAANKQGDTSRFRNMTVPVVMPQVEAAVTYQTSVFLTGYPLFGVVASPEYMTEAKQLESVLEEQSVRGGWARQLMLFFRDGFKYNFSALEVSWSKEVSYAVETDLRESVTQGKAVETLWEGNAVRRLDPYNTFVDPRVPPSEVHKTGEFAGYTELMSKIALKQFLASLPMSGRLVHNDKPAFESGTSTPVTTLSSGYNYYIPDVNSNVDASEYSGTGINWNTWAGLDRATRKGMEYKDAYEVTTMYARVLPSEFNIIIPKSNTPQIFKLIIINHAHIIYCERQTNAHNYLPILVGQPLEDGLSYQTKSLADNGAEFQDLASSYMNSIIDSRRRAITDRVLYDPSRISSVHINSPNPSAKIPVRPAAYGKPLQEAVYPFPYREDQMGSSMQQVQVILGMANQLSGQNLAQQGQFVKGNKTLHEFESVMQNAAGRDQMAAILLEHQVFTPMKLILKLNILQYQGGTTIYNRDEKKVVEIDPVALRRAVLNFKVSDGLLPASKLLNSESFSVAMQVIGSSPQIANSYNIGQLFSYIMKTQGADIAAFEKSSEQLAYEQAVSQWQNVMQLAVQKGVDPKTLGAGEMPTPEMFGYNPKNNTPAPKETKQVTQPTSGII